MEYQTFSMLNPGSFKNLNHNDEFGSPEKSNLLTILFVAFLLAWIAGLIIYDSLNRSKERIE